MSDRTAKKIAGIIFAVIMGAVGFKNTYDEQKREEEFEQLKSDVAELKETMKGSE